MHMFYCLPLHQFYMKLWHASGEVSSTSEFQYVATSLKATACAWWSDETRPGGCVYLPLEAVDPSSVIVTHGETVGEAKSEPLSDGWHGCKVQLACAIS